MKRTLSDFSATNLIEAAHLQAYKVKLLYKCPPRGTFGAIEVNMAKRNQQDYISNKANGEIKINLRNI